MGTIDPNYMIPGMIEYATRVFPCESEEIRDCHIEYIRNTFLKTAAELSGEDLNANLCYLEDTQQYISEYLNFIQVLSKTNGEAADKRERFLRHALKNLGISDTVELLDYANVSIAIGLEVLKDEKNKRTGVKQQTLV